MNAMNAMKCLVIVMSEIKLFVSRMYEYVLCTVDTARLNIYKNIL